MALVKAGAIIASGLLGFAGGLIGAGAVWLARAWWPAHLTATAATLMTGFTASLVGFLAIVVATWGVISSRAIARSQTTMQHIAATEADSTIKLAQRRFNALARQGDLAEYAKKSYEGSDELQAILTVLNGFELISIGIQRGIVEPQFYDRWYHSAVISAWKNAQPFVVALRARVESPSLYHEFEELARAFSHDKLPRRRFWWTGIIFS